MPEVTRGGLFPPGMVALLRCDAGKKHGLGHLSRCMTLAAALSKAGVTPRFALNAPAHIQERVRGAGYSLMNVGFDVGSDNTADWLESDVRLLVIDSKEATNAYVRLCRRQCSVACFDDETARSLPCDVLINNNVWSSHADYQNIPNSMLLIGPAFNTVDPGYYKLADRRRNGLLITLGGEDPHNHTTWLVRTLAQQIGGLSTHVCIGPAHPEPESVIKACKDCLPNATIHCSPPSLLDLAAQCHIALSAGGTTCYELAAAGIAMAVLAVEEHQTRLLYAMEHAGAALPLGRFDTLDSANVSRTYGNLSNPLTASHLVGAGKRLFPNTGVEEIVKALASALAKRAMAA